MSALLAGSRCSIRVVSFLIERCDPFYYSALLSSIMRPDTARYPLANAYLFYPRSTVFQFRRRSVAASLPRRSRTVTRCTTGVQRHEQLRSFVLRAETGPIRLLPKIEKIGCARCPEVSVEFNLENLPQSAWFVCWKRKMATSAI